MEIFKADHYSQELTYHKLKSAWELLEIKIPAGSRVLIKPNVVNRNAPAKATVTHYIVIDALCRLLTELHCRIAIGDSSAFYQAGFTARGFRVSRIAGVAAFRQRWDY